MTQAPTQATEKLEPGEAASRPMRKDALRNRELLIEAAREVFAARGLEASLDDIARHAGLGVGTAYRHFGNKYELVSAIAEQEFARVVGFAEQALTVEDTWAAIIGFFEQLLALQADSRGLREVFMGAHDTSELEEMQERLLGPLTALLERAQQAGTVRADADPSDLGFFILMLCTVTDVAGDVAPQLWRRYLPLVLAGLRPGGDEFGAAAISSDELRVAITEHKHTMARAVEHSRPVR